MPPSHDAQKGWIIDVCIVCHREAKWPFCEHRDKLGAGWCVPIPVVPTNGAIATLKHARTRYMEADA